MLEQASIAKPSDILAKLDAAATPPGAVMSNVVLMPEVLTGMTEAVLTAWFVEPGAEVVAGEPLVEVETEKATVGYEAEVSGTLVEQLAEVGATVTVGSPLARLAGEEDATPAPAEKAAPAVVTAPLPVEVPTVPASPPVSSTTRNGTRLMATPLVRRLARERNLDLTDVRGSGPGGRIVRRDLDRVPDVSTEAPPPVATSAPPPEPAGASQDRRLVPHSRMRRAIARRLTESKATVPHFYLDADCSVDALLALRAEVNAQSGVKLSVNDFVVKAVALALRDVPAANASWGDDAVTLFDSVDVGVAVALDDGLVTPVVRGVDGLSMSRLSTGLRDLVDRAREGKLKQHELEGGAICISNLGMFGIERFAAIINPPQAGILAVGAATPRAVVRDGQVEVATLMTVTLSGDHRVLDGAVAALWLTTFVQHIEKPWNLLL